jgi:hypothetical protein
MTKYRDRSQYYLSRRGEALADAKANYYANYATYADKRNSPRGKYTRQMRRAAERGIEFLFTFDSWLAWWGDDFALRGNKAGSLVMARKGDIGPHSPDNCYKTTLADNVAEATIRRYK